MATGISWLDAIFGRLFKDGVDLGLTGALNFKTPLTAAPNPTTGAIDIGLEDDVIAPDMLAVAPSDGVGVPFVIRKTFTAGVTGAADDVAVVDADQIPYSYRILDAFIRISDLSVGSTARLRTATGGLGSALSNAFDTGTTGIKRLDQSGSNSVLNGNPIYLRRSDRAIAGAVVIWAERV